MKKKLTAIIFFRYDNKIEVTVDKHNPRYPNKTAAEQKRYTQRFVSLHISLNR